MTNANTASIEPPVSAQPSGDTWEWLHLVNDPPLTEANPGIIRARILSKKRD